MINSFMELQPLDFLVHKNMPDVFIKNYRKWFREKSRPETLI